MIVTKLELSNFRNYKLLELDLDKQTNILYGNNAQGKTNILEAIYYCAFAKSHRTSKDKELINWNGEHAFISVDVGRERLDKRIDISILKDGKKSIRINKIKIKKNRRIIWKFQCCDVFSGGS